MVFATVKIAAVAFGSFAMTTGESVTRCPVIDSCNKVQNTIPEISIVKFRGK